MSSRGWRKKNKQSLKKSLEEQAKRMFELKKELAATQQVLEDLVKENGVHELLGRVLESMCKVSMNQPLEEHMKEHSAVIGELSYIFFRDDLEKANFWLKHFYATNRLQLDPNLSNIIMEKVKKL